MDSNTKYIQNTSEYIGEVKQSFIKVTDKLRDVAKVIDNIDSPKQTKAQTKQELTEELSETVSELRKIVQKTSDLSTQLNSLAQDSNGRN